MKFFDKIRRKKGKEEKYEEKEKQNVSSMNFSSHGKTQTEEPKNVTKEFLDSLGISTDKQIKNLETPDETIRYIKAIPLMGFSDIDALESELNAGNIIVLNLDPFLERSSGKRELDRIIARLKGLARTVRGDIAQLGTTPYIVLTPPSIKVWTEEEI